MFGKVDWTTHTLEPFLPNEKMMMPEVMASTARYSPRECFFPLIKTPIAMTGMSLEDLARM